MKKNEKKLEENCNFPKKWKIAIFLGFFSFFFIFFHCFFMFFIFFSFFFIVLSFFIIFASSGAKIFRKIKKCNVPRFFFFFSIFLSFFIIFYHFSSFLSFFINSTTGSKNDKKMIKKWKKLGENCNFHFLDFFFAPLEEKMIKKW